MNPNWINVREEPSPLLRDDLTWGDRTGRRPIRVAYYMNRDEIFADLYAKASARRPREN